MASLSSQRIEKIWKALEGAPKGRRGMFEQLQGWGSDDLLALAQARKVDWADESRMLASSHMRATVRSRVWGLLRNAWVGEGKALVAVGVLVGNLRLDSDDALRFAKPGEGWSSQLKKGIALEWVRPRKEGFPSGSVSGCKALGHSLATDIKEIWATVWDQKKDRKAQAKSIKALTYVMGESRLAGRLTKPQRKAAVGELVQNLLAVDIYGFEQGNPALQTIALNAAVGQIGLSPEVKERLDVDIQDLVRRADRGFEKYEKWDASNRKQMESFLVHGPSIRQRLIENTYTYRLSFVPEQNARERIQTRNKRQQMIERVKSRPSEVDLIQGRQNWESLWAIYGNANGQLGEGLESHWADYLDSIDNALEPMEALRELSFLGVDSRLRPACSSRIVKELWKRFEPLYLGKSTQRYAGYNDRARSQGFFEFRLTKVLSAGLRKHISKRLGEFSAALIKEVPTIAKDAPTPVKAVDRLRGAGEDAEDLSEFMGSLNKNWGGLPGLTKSYEQLQPYRRALLLGCGVCDRATEVAASTESLVKTSEKLGVGVDLQMLKASEEIWKGTQAKLPMLMANYLAKGAPMKDPNGRLPYASSWSSEDLVDVLGFEDISED